MFFNAALKPALIIIHAKALTNEPWRLPCPETFVHLLMCIFLVNPEKTPTYNTFAICVKV